MAITLAVDGVDMSAKGVTVLRAPQRRRMPTAEWPHVVPPGSGGGVLTSDVETVPSRTLDMELLVEGTSAANLKVVRSELLDRLDVEGGAQVEFSDWPGEHFLGRLVGEPETRPVTDAVTSAQRVTVRLWLEDPYRRDNTTTTVSTITTATAVAISDAPVWPTITINGAFTNPTIVLKAWTGVTQKSLSLTLTKSGGESVVLTMAGPNPSIVDDGGTDQLAALDEGSDFPFRLDPRFAQSWASNHQTLEVDSGDLDVSYRIRHK